MTGTIAGMVIANLLDQKDLKEVIHMHVGEVMTKHAPKPTKKQQGRWTISKADIFKMTE
jgi:hypothetical protein